MSSYSVTAPLPTPPDNPRQPSPAAYPLPERDITSFSVNPSTPPNSQGTDTLPRGFMGSPGGMEQRPVSRERKAANPK